MRPCLLGTLLTLRAASTVFTASLDIATNLMPDTHLRDRCQSFHSKVFGLGIRSVLPLPMSVPAFADPDLEVIYGEVPEQLSGATAWGLSYQARPGRLLLNVDGVARYLVCDGNRIVIDRAAGVQDDDVRLFLLGSALGALLHQRHAIVLHGSAVIIDGKAVAFIGPSGIGKSTLAVAFSRRGTPVLTDDLCVAWPERANGQILVEPGVQESKLWMDSLQHLDIDTTGLQRVRHSLEKRALPLGAAFAGHAAPLKRIYVLRTCNDLRLGIVDLQGAEKFAALKHQTYRVQFLDGLGAKPAHFRNAMLLAQQIPVAVIERPRGAFQLEDLMALVTADLQT